MAQRAGAPTSRTRCSSIEAPRMRRRSSSGSMPSHVSTSHQQPARSIAIEKATVVPATSAALRALGVVATETVPVHLFQVESTWTAIMRRTPRAHCGGHHHDTHQVFQGGLTTPTNYLPHANMMETAARSRHGACYVESSNKFRY